jgi:transposase
MKTTVLLDQYCVGIDVSKDKLDVCLMASYQDRSCKVKASKKFDNTHTGIATMHEWVQKHIKETTVRLCYVMEVTGVYHEELAWYLFGKDAEVIVEPAKPIKHFGISMGIKTKNDKADAQVIARYGLSKPLKRWKPISKTIYELRLLTRQYRIFNAQKTQLLNQLHALKHSGYENEWMRTAILPIVEQLEQKLDVFQQQIKHRIEADEVLKNKIDKLCSIKGIGLMAVATIVAETNGFASVHNHKQLTSWAGLDVTERQSGKYAGKTTISKQGNSNVRAALFFPALNVVKYIPIFKNLQERIYERTKRKMKGYVAVQRKLLCLLYTLWKTDTEFDPDFEKNKATPKTIVEKQNASLLEIVSEETSPLSNAKIAEFC